MSQDQTARLQVQNQNDSLKKSERIEQKKYYQNQSQNYYELIISLKKKIKQNIKIITFLFILAILIPFIVFSYYKPYLQSQVQLIDQYQNGLQGIKREEQIIILPSKQEEQQQLLKNQEQQQKQLTLEQQTQETVQFFKNDKLFNFLVKKFIHMNINDKNKISKGNTLFKNTGISYSKMAIAQIYRVIINNIDSQPIPESILSKQMLQDQQYKYYNNKYGISLTKTELPFCIVLLPNSGKKNSMRSFQSIFQQKYTNYHLLTVNQNIQSEQQQAKLLKQLQELPNNNKIDQKIDKVIDRSFEDIQVLLNIVKNQHCRQNQVILKLNKGDQLIGCRILQLYNTIHQKNNAWIVTSNSISSDYRVGESHPFQQYQINANQYRQDKQKNKNFFFNFELTTFYASLLSQINQKDLKDQKNNYLNDSANNFFLPILHEMSHEKHAYLPEITYFYEKQQVNSLTVRNYVEKYLQRIPRYSPLLKIQTTKYY